MNMLLSLSHAKVLFLLVVCNAAFGSPSLIPDDSAIRIEGAKQLLKSGPILEKASQQSRAARPMMPKVDAVAKSYSIDPAVVAKQFETLSSADETGLYVMVSFAMPRESIFRLAEQASKAGGALVLRGAVENSLKKTAELAAEIVNKYPGVKFEIDPNLFRRYSIKHVPTFVIARRNSDIKNCTRGCDAADHFASVAGDVSLDYALEYLARQGGDPFSAFAEDRLKKIRKPF